MRTYSGLLGFLALLSAACSGATTRSSTRECDAECRDGGAARAVREMMKLLYNLTLQGQPVGEQDATVPCPQGGSARVFGTATSNAEQGTTEVTLTYGFDECSYLQRDEDPGENYDVVLSAEVEQWGVIAVQPSATTALVMQSESVSLEGTVDDPPHDYRIEACELDFAQDGGRLSGRLCGRVVGVDL